MMDDQNTEGRNVKTIGILILAAGEGSRMGHRPKCLIELDHQPLISRQLKAIEQLGIGQRVIVSGFFNERIEAVIANEAVQIIRNPDPKRGQQSSVRLGLETMHTDLDLVIIALADQPLINASDLQELITAFNDRPVLTDVMYPLVHAQRGNPVLLSGAFVREYLTRPAAMTCRQYIDCQRARVYAYQTSNDHFTFDLDTPEDLNALACRTGYAVSQVL
jgi:CTP:molybdopterin cytidylyltransferase MocA